MDIKTIPFSRLEADLRGTLDRCADSGQTVVVELPDQRLIAIQTLDAAEQDSLIDDLIRTNPQFRAKLARSNASPRKPFLPKATQRRR